MDQDNDGVLGESTQDRYTATFSIGDQYVFNSTDTPKSVPALSTTRSNLTISDDLQIADLDVRIHLTSTDVGYLSATLVSPTGQRVALVPMFASPVGPAYANTTFSDEATGTITGSTSPFTGTFKPATPLSAMDGLSTQGTWSLEVLSVLGATINSWSMIVVAAPPRITVSD